MELNVTTSERRPRLSPRINFDMLDQLCLNALRTEAAAWPKPGLVSPLDSGSHHDMNFDLFLKSILALGGTFSAMATAAAFGDTYEALMAIGRKAESRMLQATNGINTHRGAIFNLGLLTSAAALRQSSPDLVGLNCGRIVAQKWGEQILAARPLSAATHGKQVFQRYGKAGARGEAAAGFPMVYHYGVPTLRFLLQNGYDHERAAVGTLMALIEQVDDSNLLWRGGEEGLSFAKQSARSFNGNGGVTQPGWQDKLIEMHGTFVERRLSPGGSADLLAASWVAYHLEFTI